MARLLGIDGRVSFKRILAVREGVSAFPLRLPPADNDVILIISSHDGNVILSYMVRLPYMVRLRR